MVKNLHVMWETWVPPLGRGGPLEEGMATSMAPVFVPEKSHG